MPHPNDRGIGTDIEEWYGGEMMPGSSTVRDYYWAFQSALQAIGTGRGFTLLFGPQDYHFSNTLTLNRGMVLQGQGGHGTAFGTRFLFAPGKHGIIARFADAAATPPPGGGHGRSDVSVIENIVIEGDSRYPLADEPEMWPHGIWALAPMRISNCIIKNWGGNGIRITSAPATPEERAQGAPEWSSSTSLSLVEHCLVQLCGWRGVAMARKESWEPRVGDDFYDGVYIEGANSNGSLFSSVHSLTNGRWGFYDESGLGCTFVTCMTHGNGIVKEVIRPGEQMSHLLPDGGSYKVVLPSARSVFIGCYAESDQRVAEVGPLTLVFGGAMAVDQHQGQWYRTDTSRLLQLDAGVSVFNRSRGHEWVRATLGTAKGYGGGAFEAVNQVHPTNPRAPGLPLNLIYDQTTKNWAWRHDSKEHMVIGTTGENTQLGVAGGVSRGHVLFPQGMLFGQETGNIPQIHLKYEGRHGGAAGMIQGIAKTQMVSGVETTFFEGYAPRVPNGGTWNVGDRLWNVNPESGDCMGWVYTASGWREFGAVA